MQQTDLREIAQMASPSLKVSGESKPQSVARAIGHVAREGTTLPMVQATGPAAINQAIKAIAIARRQGSEPDGMLVDGGDLAISPEFEQGLRDGSRAIMHLSKVAQVVEGDEEDSLSATPRTDMHKLAGAIAGRVREGQQNLTIFVKGAVPVLIAVKSIAKAQEYLEEARLSLKFVASLVERESKELRGSPVSTFTQFVVLSQPAVGEAA